MPVADALGARARRRRARCRRKRCRSITALGRVLAAGLAALRTQPPAAVSAMDGYAVRAADVAQAPVTLKLIGEVAAGHPFDGEVSAGEAARIFTGGVMPSGADTVVIQELTARDGDRVTIQKPTAKGRNVRGRGIDFAQGQVLLRQGTRLSDRDLMLAAAMNHAHLPVHRRPKVAVLGTGDELVRPGGTPEAGRDRLFQRLRAHCAGASARARGCRFRHRARPHRGYRRRGAQARATGAPIFW